jgi:hypothetical protein
MVVWEDSDSRHSHCCEVADVSDVVIVAEQDLKRLVYWNPKMTHLKKNDLKFGKWRQQASIQCARA